MARLKNFRLHGVSVWCDPDDMLAGRDFSLAKDEHVTAGELNTFRGEMSHGHYFPDAGILRHGRKIGDLADLIPVEVS